MVRIVRMSITRPSDESINGEITRLGKILDSQQIRYLTKITIASMIGDKSKSKTCLEYYEISIDYIKSKRRFWSQYRDKSMDKNALDIIQDKMDLWLQKAWEYLGMEQIEKDSKDAKEEFQLFKLMYESTPKKTRRKKKK